jgi:hypothetical protein
MLQGHRKIIQRCNTNSEAQAIEDSSELGAQAIEDSSELGAQTIEDSSELVA